MPPSVHRLPNAAFKKNYRSWACSDLMMRGKPLSSFDLVIDEQQHDERTRYEQVISAEIANSGAKLVAKIDYRFSPFAYRYDSHRRKLLLTGFMHMPFKFQVLSLVITNFPNFIA